MNFEEVIRMSKKDRKHVTLEQWIQVLGFFILDHNDQQFFTQIDNKQVFGSEAKKREFIHLLLERFLMNSKAQERNRKWYGTKILDIVTGDSMEYSPVTPTPNNNDNEKTIKWNLSDLELQNASPLAVPPEHHKRTLGESLKRLPGQILHPENLHLKDDLLHMLHLKHEQPKENNNTEVFDTLELGNVPFLDEVYEDTESYHPYEETNSWLTHPPNLKEHIQLERHKKWIKKDKTYYGYLSSYYNHDVYEEYNPFNQRWAMELFKSKEVREKYAKKQHYYIDFSALGVVDIIMSRGIAKYIDDQVGHIKLPVEGYPLIEEDEEGQKTIDMSKLNKVEVYPTKKQFAYSYSKKKYAYLPPSYKKWMIGNHTHDKEYFKIKPLEHAPTNDHNSVELFDDGEFFSDFIIHSEQEEHEDAFKSLFSPTKERSTMLDETPILIEIPDFLVENANAKQAEQEEEKSKMGSQEALDEFSLDLPFDVPSISESDIVINDVESENTNSNTDIPSSTGLSIKWIPSTDTLADIQETNKSNEEKDDDSEPVTIKWNQSADDLELEHHIKWTSSTDNLVEKAKTPEDTLAPAITIEDFSMLQQQDPGDIVVHDLITSSTRHEDISEEEKLEIRSTAYCYRVLTIISRERLGIDQLLHEDMFHHLITIMFSAPTLKHPSLSLHTRAVSKLLINLCFHSPHLRNRFCKLLLDQRFTSIFLNHYLLPSRDHMMAFDTVIVATRLLYISCFDIANTTLFYTKLPWIIADLIMVLERGWYLVGQHTVNKPKTEDDQPTMKKFQTRLKNKNFQLFATEVLKFVHISLERLNKRVDIVKYIYHRQLLNVLRWILLSDTKILSFKLLRAATLVIMSSGNTFLKKLFLKVDESKKATYKSRYISKSFLSGMYASVEKFEGSQIFLPTTEKEYAENKEEIDDAEVDEELLVACIQKIVYMAAHGQYKYKQLIVPLSLTLTRVIQLLRRAEKIMQQCVLYENETVLVPRNLTEKIKRDYRMQMREFADLYSFNCERFKVSRKFLSILKRLFPQKHMQLEEKIMEPKLSMEDMRDQLLENGNIQILHVFKYLILYSRSHDIARAIGLFLYNLCESSRRIFSDHLGATTYNFLAITLENENLIAALPLEQQIKL